MKHGQGIMTFEDGTEYDGVFERDRMWNRMLSGEVEVKQESTVFPRRR